MLFHLREKLESLDIVLASGSPRRKELLRQIGVPFRIRISSFAEDIPKEPYRSRPQDYVLATATKKAEFVWSAEEGERSKGGMENVMVIAADTVVVHQDTILEKPEDEDDAFRTISSLCGTSHSAITAVVIVTSHGTERFFEETRVDFGAATPEEVRGYISTGEWRDKAGGYGIQGAAASFIERIHGDYYAVVGLPLRRTAQVLKKILADTD